ncbi:hypothetical protein KKC13_07445 [bacterium]|nr:hypothetical protein [bacterium]MBU1958442.1 hypothetical protein [bacterium]
MLNRYKSVFKTFKSTHVALSTLFLGAVTMTGCIDQGKSSPNQVYIYTDNGTTKTKGYLVDSAVQGVNYECDSGETIGVTGSDGAFECKAAPVTFKLGGMTLGTISSYSSGGQILPQDLVGVSKAETSNAQVIKIARLLQSLDSDGDPSNGITIDTTKANKLTASDSLSETVEALAAKAGIDAGAIVSEEDAIDHLSEASGLKPKETLSGDITTDTTLTATKTWVLDGLVAVKDGATLTIEAGTTIVGKDGTGDNTSYMIIDKGAKIMAEGTAANPITFTSETAYDGGTAAWGQWGGLTLIGKAGNTQVQAYEVNSAFEADSSNLTDNSGSLKYVKILNSGITMETDKEINGLSLVGVGSGTTIENITVNKSDDDCVEIWGGTVNLKNVTLSECSDDHFDIDDGYAGTVSNLIINQTTGNAGIEMSGTTHATFDTFTITQTTSVKEGGIYFKNDGIGGHFKNGTVTDNSIDGTGTIYSKGIADIANTSFENVTLAGSSTDTRFSGDSADTLLAKFNAGTGNTIEAPKEKETISGDITSNTTLINTKIWVLDGLVAVKDGATLTIDAGTTIVGKDGTGDNTSYMIIDKGAKIMAVGTESQPIIFTSETAYNGGTAAVGQWGGLTLIGKAGNSQVQAYEVNTAFVPDDSDLEDNSGTLKHVQILNSGITMEIDKEINGLSLVGVGSGTTIEDITVSKSDDDCVEAWGGTVNMKNITVSECTDDHFDIDDGYAGTVTNLTINQTGGNAAIEMSGTTAATFNTFVITQTTSKKEGGIYFKQDGVGGHFINGFVTDNSTDGAGTIHSKGTADIANTSFTNVILDGSSTDAKFTGDSATELEAEFNSGTENSSTGTKPKATLSGEITTDTTLIFTKTWVIDGLVAVKDGATLTIDPGTTIAGKDGTGDNTSYMIIDKGAKIMAEGSSEQPIIFTSETAYDGGTAAVGQWGGLTLIGKAGNDQVQAYEVNSAFTADSSDLTDNSGSLKHVQILNSGITMETDKEINGLSLVGVGSGTTIENITVTKSDDDCVEAWGGTVNMKNITISECTDDHFDIDDGYAGTVTNLTINQTGGNAAIEMSGTTAATFDTFNITQTTSVKEGGIYFKNDGIGGHFKNGTVTDNSIDSAGTIHSKGTADIANTSFENVVLAGSSTDTRFSGDSATELEAKFTAGTGNTAN